MNIYLALSGILTTYYVMFIKHVIQQSVRMRIKRYAKENSASPATEVIINSKTKYNIYFFLSSPELQPSQFSMKASHIQCDMNKIQGFFIYITQEFRIGSVHS